MIYRKIFFNLCVPYPFPEGFVLLFLFFGTKSLSSLQPSTEPMPTAGETWSPNHWAAREAPPAGFELPDSKYSF